MSAIAWIELTTPEERRAARRSVAVPPELTGEPVVAAGVKSRVLRYSVLTPLAPSPRIPGPQAFAELRDGRLVRVNGYDSIAGVFRGVVLERRE